MAPVIAESARKHGVLDEDMLHAYRNPWDRFDEDDEFVMLVGADRAGLLIEVGLVVADDGAPVVVHADRPARTKYLPR